MVELLHIRVITVFCICFKYHAVQRPHQVLYICFSMPAITCKQCHVLVYKTSDGICMHCRATLWGYANEEETEKASVHSVYHQEALPGFRPQSDKRRRQKRWLLFACLAITAIVAFAPIRSWMSPHRTKTVQKNTIVPRNCNLSQSAIYDRYKNAVGLVLHEYVYEISIDGSKPLAFTKNAAGDFILYHTQNLPIAINGTGFFADSLGLILTNRHVAAPWRSSKGDRQRLLLSVQNLLPPQLHGTQALNWLKNNWSQRTALVQNDSLKISYRDSTADNKTDSTSIAAKKPAIQIWARTIYLGIALHNMPAERNRFIPCTIERSADSSGIDIAILKTNLLPRGVMPVDMNQAVVSDDSLKPGTRAILIGYPLGMDLALVKGGIIKVQIQDGQLNKESDGLQVQYNIPSAHGASGSPVFNDCGKLIAINYAGYDEVQGFNFGILARHAVQLMEELKNKIRAVPLPSGATR